MKHQYLIEFFWHLAQAERAGIPLRRSVAVYAQDCSGGSFRTVLAHLSREMDSGARLSETMNAYPHIFDRTLCMLVHTGETAGRLAQALDRCCAILKQRDVRRREMKRMTRPAIITAVILAALTLVQGKMSMLIPCLLAVLAIAALWLGRRHFAAVRRMTDSVLAQMPLIGPVLLRHVWARYVENLAYLYDSGIPLKTAADLAAQALPLQIQENTFAHIRDSLAQKSSLHTAFQQVKGMDRFILAMVRAGENSGALGHSLHEAAARLDQETDAAITRLLQYAAPAMTVLLGLYVYRLSS